MNNTDAIQTAIEDKVSTYKEQLHAVSYLDDTLRPAGSAQAGDQVITINAPYRLAFIDRAPGANWMHPARYLLISSDSKIKSVESNRPPVFGILPSGWRVVWRPAGLRTGSLCPSHHDHRTNLETQERAMPLNPTVADRIKRVAVAGLAPSDVATTHLSLAADMFPAGHVFNLVDSTLTVRAEAALLFIDKQPGAKRGHPCTYRFFHPPPGSSCMNRTRCSRLIWAATSSAAVPRPPR